MLNKSMPVDTGYTNGGIEVEQMYFGARAAKGIVCASNERRR